MAIPPALKPAPSLIRGCYPEREVVAGGLWPWLESEIGAWAGKLRQLWRVPSLPASGVATASARDRVMDCWKNCIGHEPAPDVIAAAGLLCENRRLVELADSTLMSDALSLAALAMALDGIPVHVICAGQSAALPRQIEPMAERLGLSTAVIGADETPENRRLIYRKSIVAVTYRQLVFDYLLDRRLLMGQRSRVKSRLFDHTRKVERRPLLRGLSCALVSDVQEVLIGGAEQPIAVATAEGGELRQQVFAEAIDCAEQMLEGVDYLVDGLPVLTDVGASRLPELTAGCGPLWRGPRRARQMVRAALQVLRFKAGNDYRLEGDHVVLDPGHSLIAGLSEGDYRQLVLASLGRLDESAAQSVQLRISLQNFIVRYLHLAAAVAVQSPDRRELRRIYGLEATTVGTALCPDASIHLYGNSAARMTAIENVLHEQVRDDAPVLLLCRDSESRKLFLAGLTVALSDRLQPATPQRAITRCLSVDGEEQDLHECISSGLYSRIIAVETPASLLQELRVRGTLGPGQSLEIYGSADEELFAGCSSWQRRLMPFSRALYRTLRYHLEEGGRRRRRLVAEHDAYIRQTLAFTREGGEN